MRDDTLGNIISACHNAGIRIYPVETSFHSYRYRLVIARATKYKPSEIPKDRPDDYEVVGGTVYRLQHGKETYPSEASNPRPAWFEKAHELYRELHKTIKPGVNAAREKINA